MATPSLSVRAAVAVLAAGTALAATARDQAGDAAAEPRFSGARAMEHLEEVCRLGPRPSGSPAMTRQRELLAAHFRGVAAATGGHAATVAGQAFQIRDRRTGRPVHMENLIVSWHPDRADRVLVAAHYDTRPFPDRDPVDPRGEFVGANDGASGVALLMELARAMPVIAGPVGVDFVLFDAEEYVVEDRDPYCLGSTFFARQYAAEQASGKATHRYRAGVVVDMVADRDLEIWQERHSVTWPDTRPVVDEIWAAARRLGVRQFVAEPRHTVEDDHVPLRMIGGIPTCDVIDFDYPAWHTTADVPARCSAEALEAVGSVILEWLRTQR
jgi:glutaminyl-peptide cyclotransferase